MERMAFLAHYKTKTTYTTGNKKLYARAMEINYHAIIMQNIKYLLFISIVFVSLYLVLYIQYYVISITMYSIWLLFQWTNCGYEIVTCTMLCSRWLPFQCTKCGNEIVSLSIIILSDIKINIHIKNLSMWEYWSLVKFSLLCR